MTSNTDDSINRGALGTALTWTSVTTGNLAGIDIWLDEARRGMLKLDTNVVLTTLADGTVAFDGSGLPAAWNVANSFSSRP
jgi:hypothetical protein